ncbi:uncharacterized protein N7484_000463 [Penicillium longicatenatum]|uniref:uncharacterized protein n=1 Tax=Penicillium longicatenatum TaxID=1561947 RepID=UPI00254997F3|nr:uncharacterized protein N7484_000463 [Penicillium longicatenatum]KAJ5661091.1 hypothetical protein N7484_000463 [Penicillium longicatenatum]
MVHKDTFIKLKRQGLCASTPINLLAHSLAQYETEWVENGGITGRGALIDYYHWTKSTEKTFDVNGGDKISLQDVKDVLAFQKTTIKPGDILIFRTGWLSWYQSMDCTVRHANLCIENKPGAHRFIGLAQEADFVAWLWKN